MSRYKDTQIQNKAYAKNAMMPITNLGVPGQNGYITDMAYYPSATDYIRKPLIIKVLQVPVGLTLMPNATEYIAAYKNFIECMMQSWSGFNMTLNVANQETQLGQAGEVFQTPSRVSRARSQVTSTVVEKDNMPVIRFLEDMTRYLIGDPDVGHALLSGVTDAFVDQLADMYGGTIIAYEPDKPYKKVQRAWLITNFWITGDIGENTGTRTMQADGETVTYNLTWTGWQKVGYAVNKLAQSFMDATKVTGIDPQYQPTFVTGVDSNVAAASNVGYGEQITSLKRQLVTP